MTVSIWPVTPGFVAEVGDADLAHLSDEDLAAIKQAFWDYAVLIFPDQRLDHDQHLAFAGQFGPLETTIATHRSNKLRLRPEFADVSNITEEDEIWGEQSRVRQFQLANRLWHTDRTFTFVPART